MSGAGGGPVGPHRMPEGLVLDRTTAELTDQTMPAGLRRAHRVAHGVWGRLRVQEGSVTFVFEDVEGGTGYPVAAGQWVDIPPATPHRVEPDPGARFAVEFHVAPAP